MATSSIMKNFVVRDKAAYRRLKKELNKKDTSNREVVESSSLKRSREKLATFVFR